MPRPLIGIGADVGTSGARDRAFGYMSYVEALRRAGAMPVLIPPQSGNVAELLEQLDGVLLAGGRDCDPALYGEEAHATVEPMDERRQGNDLALAAAARQAGVPAFGICLGLQVMNVAAGGTLIQDIASAIDTTIRHESEPGQRVRHPVAVHAGTRLHSILGGEAWEVNSSHHQSVKDPGAGLVVTAQADDGVVEALEDPSLPFYVGVQWHPEDMAGEPAADPLFAAFVEAARGRAERRRALR